jgi:hypothetical protein
MCLAAATKTEMQFSRCAMAAAHRNIEKQRTIKRLSSRYLAAFNKALVFATRAKFSIAM